MELKKEKAMRIVIDMQGIQNGNRFRGIGRYANSLVKQLIIEAGKKHEIILVLNGAFTETIRVIRDEYSDFISQSKIHVWDSLSPVQFIDSNNNERRLASEVIRETYLASLHPDVVLVSSLFDGWGDDSVTSVGVVDIKLPTAVICYDLIPLIYRSEYLSDERLRNWYMEKLKYLKKADLLLSISESGTREIINFLNFPSKKVVNISAALDPNLTTTTILDVGAMRERFKIKNNYLLYAGGADPRKNLSRLITAYSNLQSDIRNTCHLVLAGKMPDENIKQLSNQALSEGCKNVEVIFKEYISDEELATLYTHARGFVFPSYHEGFGLPVLEAMFFGTPVIGANNSSVPEIIGNSKGLFNPYSIEEISHSMLKLICDESYRKDLLRTAEAQKKRFSWERSAKIALKALEKSFDKKNNYYSKNNCTYSIYFLTYSVEELLFIAVD